MKTLTVFTPTYNRGYCLHRVYESLLRQNSSDFEWLVIDDGSTDNTKELVYGWIQEDKVSITYFFKENGGMHTGHNVAHDLIKTELNVCIDSDDYLTDNAVDRIITLWRRFGSVRYAGLVGLDADKKGNIIGVKFPDGLKECTYSELKPRYGVVGDKKSVYRTEIISKYERYPTFAGETFVPLYLPLVIDKDFPVLCFNEIFCIVDYQQDGSTLNIYRQYIRNPKGWAHHRKIIMKYSPFLLVRFRNAVHFVSSSMIAKNKNLFIETPDKLLTLLAIPGGILLFVYIMLKNLKSQLPEKKSS